VLKTERVYWIFVLLSIALALLMSAGYVVKNDSVGGTDFYYHLRFAEQYAQGKLALFDPGLMQNNGGPYPPLFHLLLAFFIKINALDFFAKLLQALLFPIALASTVFLAFKLKGIRAAALCAVLLLGSTAFFDRGGQVTPQAVDIVLAPIAAWAFFEGMGLLFVISIAIMAYSHAPYSFLILVAFAVFAFAFNYRKKLVSHSLLSVAPLVLLFLPFVPQMVSMASGVNTLQEEVIRSDPLFFFFYFGIPAVLMFVVSLVLFAKFDLNAAKTKLLSLNPPSTSAFKIFLLLWLAALAPLLYFYPDRFASYAIQPASVFAGVVLGEKLDRHNALFLALVAIAFALAFYLNVLQFYNLYLA